MAKKVPGARTTLKIETIGATDPTFTADAVAYVKEIGPVGKSAENYDITNLADEFADFDSDGVPEGSEVTITLDWDNSDLGAAVPTGQALLWQNVGKKLWFKITCPDPDDTGSETSKAAIFKALINSDQIGGWQRNSKVGKEVTVKIVPSTFDGTEDLIHVV